MKNNVQLNCNGSLDTMNIKRREKMRTGSLSFSFSIYSKHLKGKHILFCISTFKMCFVGTYFQCAVMIRNTCRLKNYVSYAEPLPMHISKSYVHGICV